MDTALLKKYISVYKQNLAKDPEKHTKDLAERKEWIAYYQFWTKERILAMTEEDFYDYLSRLWAMLIWGIWEHQPQNPSRINSSGRILL